jgi:hypothetical protein
MNSFGTSTILGFEVLTSVVMKCTLFCDIRHIIRWKSTEVSEERRHFFLCRWPSRAICKPSCHLLSRWYLGRLLLRPWGWRRYVLPKCQLTFNGLFGVISQMMVLFIDSPYWEYVVVFVTPCMPILGEYLEIRPRPLPSTFFLHSLFRNGPISDPKLTAINKIMYT